MDTIYLESGDHAPELEDRIRLTKAGPEAWRWGGSIAYRHEAVFKDCPDYYKSREEAERDALDWAHIHGVEKLYIEIDDA
jgi:hypothetical protein